MLSNLEAVRIDLLPKPWLDCKAVDKVILVVLLGRPVGCQVVARELDVRTLTWNAPASVPAWHPAKLGDAIFRAVHQAFAPLAEIDSVDHKEQSGTLRLRAAGLPPRDPTLAVVQPGDVFMPVIRYGGRDGELRRDRQGNLVLPKPVPWTYFTVREGMTSSGVACSLHTGLRTPLSGRRRGRVEQLALRVAPPGKPTRLILQSRAGRQEVLAGYDVYSHPPDATATELVGRTDRQGSVMIPPGEHALRVLLVLSGGQVLARLPLVPGLETEITASIANDDQRLQAEGFLRGLQEELIDLVTRREILLAQARSRLQEGQFDEAEKLIRQLRAMKDHRDFAIYLSQEKKKVASADRLVQAKIDAMFAETQKAVNQYLNPEPIDALGRQLLDARAAPAKTRAQSPTASSPKPQPAAL